MSSLWTPYADEALDLSKPTVKPEPVQPPCQYYAPATISPVAYPQTYYPGYQVPQISPGSSSGYEETPYYQYQRAALSPPESPEADHPQSLARISSTVDMEFLSNDPEYQAFERDALRAMAEKNGGSLLGNNPRMRRSVRSTKDTVDECYRQQRERNNFAAKQSRDRRKLREVRLALKVTYLEKEAEKLRAMLASGVCTRCSPY